MAEISETMATYSSPSAETKTNSSDSSNFDHKTMRNTKPGLKRLILTLTVFFSFLLGLPWLLKSIEIYRSPLPFRDIDSLSNAIDSNPFLFPCRFHVVYVNFDHNISIKSRVENLGFSVSSYMSELDNGSSACGTRENKYAVSVSLDSGNECLEYGGVWKCGAVSEVDFDQKIKDDEVFDEYLESVLGKSKVYTVVVVNSGEGVTDRERVRAVVGKYRHAWIVGRVADMVVAEKVAEIFVKIFVNGAKEEGSIQGEFMPVGADGKIVLSFNLLNADPRDWIYDWDFREVDEKLLAPTLQALGPIANISVESQVLYHTPKSSYSYWDADQESHIFSTKDLPFFVNSNEWHLDTSIAAGGRSKILQFVVYIPSANECPLRLQLPNGEISVTNGFISPTWGGVVVLNPPNCLENENSVHPIRRKVSSQELNQIFEVFMGQLRQLFGLKSTGFYNGASGTSVLLSSETGFTQWELDALARQHACYNLRQCGTTLGSLSRLVQSLPRMIIKDEIGKQVKFSLEAAKLAQDNASKGIYDAAAVSSRHARSLAEDAFFHPSVMSVSYYSFEHMFAVYSPFFLPLSLHVILAVVKEIKRYKQESRKFAAWKALTKQHSD